MAQTEAQDGLSPAARARLISLMDNTFQSLRLLGDVLVDTHNKGNTNTLKELSVKVLIRDSVINDNNLALWLDSDVVKKAWQEVKAEGLSQEFGFLKPYIEGH